MQLLTPLSSSGTSARAVSAKQPRVYAGGAICTYRHSTDNLRMKEVLEAMVRIIFDSGMLPLQKNNSQLSVLQGKWQKDLESLVGDLQITNRTGDISVVCDGRQSGGIEGE